MSINFRRFPISFTRRTVTKNSALSSDTWNASMAEILSDFAFLQSEWNNKLVVLSSTLPDGKKDTLVDAFKFGISGAHLYGDSAATSLTNSGFFWNTVKDRPRTIKEVSLRLLDEISDVTTTLKNEIASSTAVLTAAQKARIGDNIFDSSKTSTATSLDGLTDSNKQNIVQLATDLYGTGNYTLKGDSVALLTNSVRKHIEKLLDIHAGSWDNDLTLAHSITGADIVGNINQTKVNQSASINDQFTAAATNTEEDLNRIRSVIRRIVDSGVSWTTAPSAPAGWSGGNAPTTLQEVINLTASGTRTKQNPWGYELEDIDNLSSFANKVQSFSGMSGRTDGSPTYTSTFAITQSDSLEKAIGKLDKYFDDLTGNQVEVLDSGNYFDGINVETVLQEIGSGLDKAMDAQGYRSWSAVGLNSPGGAFVLDSGTWVEAGVGSGVWNGWMTVDIPDQTKVNYFAATGHKGHATSSGVVVELRRVRHSDPVPNADDKMFSVTLSDTVLTTASQTIASGLDWDTQNQSLVIKFDRPQSTIATPAARLVGFTVGYKSIGVIV